MNETQRITNALCAHVMTQGADGALPNWFSHKWEMDVAALNRNGYFQEYEIKVSRDDFLADFRMKKKKHLLYKSLAAQKHKLRTADEFAYIPSQFYYVCPVGMLELKDIPAYAGLIWFRPGEFTLLKKAPKIHAGKPSAKLIAKYYRCMSWRLLNALKGTA